MGQIRIELLSDSCISSGETYNSSIDSDVCYDSYGFPFIPAKRLRGCLREAGLELKDFGQDIDVEALFGKPGNSSAAFILGNAKLEDYETYVRQLKSCGKKEYTHQQAVLEQFTYIRYQTEIDKERGTAKDTSLRAIRVMKKRLVFVADIDFVVNIDLLSEYTKAFALCCKNLRFMGMNRTRGMGEVRVEFINEDRDRSKPEHAAWEEGIAYDRLDYQISLKSPMLIKSVAGGQTQTIQYIDGAKILGMLAQNLGGEGLMKLQDVGKLVCANAYISDGGVRYTPASASLCGIKNEKKPVRDRACRDFEKEGNSEGKQLTQLSGVYVDSDTANEIRRLTVDTEIRYHHSRPKDKSAGHVIGGNANSQDGGSFYQMESIAEGQVFAGYILGTTEQLKKVYEVITDKPVQRMGYGKTSEYGEAEFTVTALRTEETSEQSLNSFVVKLNAPTILYNENAACAAEERLLVANIAEAIKEKNNLSTLPALTVENRFLRYGTVGGFNTTWGLHKPVINVFDAGTTLVLKVQEPAGLDIGRMKNVFLGERISEGYGEASFYPLSSVYEKKFKLHNDEKLSASSHTTEVHQKAEDTKESKNLIRDIASKRALSHIKEMARRQAAGIDVKKETAKPVIANLLMMCSQQDTLNGFRNNIQKRFDRDTEDKKAKLEMARKIIPEDFSMDMDKVRDDALKKYPEAEKTLKEDQVYKTYVTALLVALKYKVREEKI